jgi:hypothetical protein
MPHATLEQREQALENLQQLVRVLTRYISAGEVPDIQKSRFL